MLEKLSPRHRSLASELGYLGQRWAAVKSIRLPLLHLHPLLLKLKNKHDFSFVADRKSNTCLLWERGRASLRTLICNEKEDVSFHCITGFKSGPSPALTFSLQRKGENPSYFQVSRSLLYLYRVIPRTNLGEIANCNERGRVYFRCTTHLLRALLPRTTANLSFFLLHIAA